MKQGDFENLINFVENTLPSVRQNNFLRDFSILIDFRRLPKNFILDLQVLVPCSQKAEKYFESRGDLPEIFIPLLSKLREVQK